MSNKVDVQSTLSKLDELLGKNKSKPRIDFKELAELKKKNLMKLKEGKNQIVIVKPTENTDDPFFVWGFHNSLQEVSYYAVPCNSFNKNGECIICNMVNALKEEDRAEKSDKRKAIHGPIRQQTEIYVPVINVESNETIEEGLKWLRMGKSIVSQLTEWLRNLDPTEEPFYSDSEPQKIIITYKKEEVPMKQYSLDKKNMKAFSATQLANWRKELRPVADFIFSKKDEELKQLADTYLERMLNELEAANDSQADTQQTSENTAVAESKLNALKTGH